MYDKIYFLSINALLSPNYYILMICIVYIGIILLNLQRKWIQAN